MVFLFIFQYLPFSFYVPVKGDKIMKEGVSPLSQKAAACTRDIISYAPIINYNRHDVFLYVLYYIMNFIIHMCQYTRQMLAASWGEPEAAL